MNDIEWKRRLRKLERDLLARIDRVRAMQSGRMPIREVTVKEHWVPRYHVGEHQRTIVDKTTTRRKP